MGREYLVYSFGDRDFLTKILAASAKIMGDGDFVLALKTSATIGLIVVLMRMCFGQGFLSLKWLMGIIFINLVLFVPKVDVKIVNLHQQDTNSSDLIEKVPLGLALTSSFFSTFAHWPVQQLERLLNIDSSVQFSRNGYLWPQKDVLEIYKLVPQNQDIIQRMDSFWTQCTNFDLLFGPTNWDQLLNSDNLQDYLKNNTSNSRSFSSSNTTSNCKNDFSSAILDQLESSYQPLLVRVGFQEKLSYMTNKSYSEISQSKIGLNLLLFNSLKKAVSEFSNESRTRAAKEIIFKDVAFGNYGKMSGWGQIIVKTLSLMQSISEAFLYGFFPIVLVLCMLPSGISYFFRYLSALLWINLWPFLFSILHFASLYNLRLMNTTFSPLGMIEFTFRLEESLLIFSCLAFLVPIISWLLISSSKTLLSQVVSQNGFNSPIQGNLESPKVSSILNHSFQSQPQMRITQNYSLGTNSHRDFSENHAMDGNSLINTRHIDEKKKFSQTFSSSTPSPSMTSSDGKANL